MITQLLTHLSQGNLAQIYGSYLFPSKDSPKYLMGFGVISGLCATGVVYVPTHPMHAPGVYSNTNNY